MAGAEDFARLAKRLKDAGETGLRRELNQAIDTAAQPFGDILRAPGYLYPYMPNRYADVLAADLKITTSKHASATAYGVMIKVTGRLHKRQVQKLNAGILRHPLFGDREYWYTNPPPSMLPRFFTDATEAAGPGIRDAVLAAVHDVAEKIANG